MHINPYIAGKSLGGKEGFFGREGVLRFVQTALARNPIVLFGRRRIGKTSILRQLQRRLTDSYVPIYFDLMDRSDKPLGQVLNHLALAMMQAAEMSLPARIEMDDEGKLFRSQFLPSLYSTPW